MACPNGEVMYLQTRTRRRLIRSAEVFVVVLAAFVVLAPRLDEWGLIQPLFNALA